MWHFVAQLSVKLPEKKEHVNEKIGFCTANSLVCCEPQHRNGVGNCRFIVKVLVFKGFSAVFNVI